MKLTRRKFVEGTGAGAVVMALQACGGGDSGSGSGPGFGAGCGAAGTSIAGNHPAPNAHTLAVPATDLRAGLDRSYTTGGTADHVHTVALTSAQLQTLANGTAVTVTSGSAGSANFPAHTHAITVSCP